VENNFALSADPLPRARSVSVAPWVLWSPPLYLSLVSKFETEVGVFGFLVMKNQYGDRDLKGGPRLLPFPLPTFFICQLTAMTVVLWSTSKQLSNFRTRTERESVSGELLS